MSRDRSSSLSDQSLPSLSCPRHVTALLSTRLAVGVLHLSQDSFYKRHTEEEIALAHANRFDFDHPDTIDMPMFAAVRGPFGESPVQGYNETLRSVVPRRS